MHTVDLAVAELATRQAGTFSLRQVYDVGGCRQLATRRVRAGRWLSPYPHVFELPGRAVSFRRSLWLALHAADERALVSHQAAATLHRLTGFPPRIVAIVVPHGVRHTRPVGRLHQTTAPPEPAEVDGIPCTSLVRTLFDLGKVVGPRRLGRAVDDAWAEGRVSIAQLQRTFFELARPGRRTESIRLVLAARVDGEAPSRSRLERLLDSVLADVPGARAAREVDIGDRQEQPHRVDRLYVPERLIVEADGRRWHARVADLERDRARDRRATLLGYRTVRYGWAELMNDRDGVRQEVAALLGR